MKLFYFFVVLFFTACAINNPKFFADVSPTEDKTYGYSNENPILIKNSGMEKSIESSYYYLSRLRSKKGNKFELIGRASVANPLYVKPLLPMTDRYTGQNLNHGNGPILDLYILKEKNGTDTIRLYINPYIKGEIKIPYGLLFEKEN